MTVFKMYYDGVTFKMSKVHTTVMVMVFLQKAGPCVLFEMKSTSHGWNMCVSTSLYLLNIIFYDQLIGYIISVCNC